MTKICPNCKYLIQDDYDYCCKCGTSLMGLNTKLIILVYAITIILSWSWVLFSQVSNLTFCCIFFPFFFLQSRNTALKKHGVILFIICILGCIFNFYFLFR